MKRQVQASVVLLMAMLAGVSFGETIKWTGGDTVDPKDWFRSGNWDLGRVPAEGDDVKLSALENVKWEILLTNSTPHLKSFEMYHKNPSTSPEYRIYLKFKNWNTRLWADDIHIKQGGMIRTVGPFTNAEMSNRVWIAGVNMKLDYYNGGWVSNYKAPEWIKDGCIYTSLQGYQCGYGPAWPNSKSSGGGHGGAYGGSQGCSATTLAPQPYGSAAYPYDPGCGAAKTGIGSHGGGAVFLDLSGSLTVNGAILAEGSEVNGSNGGGGSGGGILINCKTLTGTGSILANGHLGNSFSLSYGRCAGSGGRIAIHYNPEEQAKVLSDCKVEISAHGGGGGGMTPITRAVNSSGVAAERSDPGTLWFPDNQLLHRSPLKLAGVLANVAPNSELTFDSGLAVSSGLLGFAVPVKLSVTGDLSLSGKASHAYGLWFEDSAEVKVSGNATVNGAMVTFKNGGLLAVGGDLTLTNASASTWYTGGELDVCGSAAGTAGEPGMEVKVGGTLALASKSVIWPRAHATSGSVVRFEVKNAEFKSGSAVDGIGLGYAAKVGPGYEGTGKAASHAGEGAVQKGSTDKLYGNRRRPTLPGSGSSYYPGGGVFWVEAREELVANADIMVVGGQSYQGNPMSSCNGGSGGSLFVRAQKLTASAGTMSAAGGHGDGQNGSWGGGGGRVAICTTELVTNGTFCVTAAGGESIKSGAPRAEGPGGDGTVYFGRWPVGLSVLIR